MNRSRIATTFFLALVIAGLASFLVMKQLNRGKVQANVSVRRVVMAAKDLEVGEKLSDQDVKLADWAVGDPPTESFFNVQDAIGRAVLYPTFRNEIILSNKVASMDAGAGMSAVIPAGMRAVSIRVDEVVAVAGFVGPGSRVDVLLTGNPGAGAQGSEILTKMILENVQVLAAGQKIQPDAHGTPEKVNVVTLLCNLEDASKLTLGASDGRIQLVLRNPTDFIKSVQSRGVGRRALYGFAPEPELPLVRVSRRIFAPAPALPAPPPPPQPAPIPAPPVVVAPPPVTVATIEILRGDQRSTVQVRIAGAGDNQ